MPAWTQVAPRPQSAALQPAEGFYDSSGRSAANRASPSPAGSGLDAATNTASQWEPFATITWQTWLMSAWFAVVLWQIVRLANQRRRLAALLSGRPRTTWGLSRFRAPCEAWSDENGTVPLAKVGVAAGRPLGRGGFAGGELCHLVAELSQQAGLRRAPAVVWVAGDCPLFVCGLWRPRLVLPDQLFTALTPTERRQVVLHELAHLKRHDLLWGWPAEIARIIYFFNPLVHWVAYQLRLERELACDQFAMAHSGHPPADYAQTLVQVVSHASEPAAVQAAAIAAGLIGNQATPKPTSPSKASCESRRDDSR
jgi:beta-lactamase regulating signal transducer with metallopeptidase domain